VVLAGNRIASVLDTKYRDLWEHSLPRDMLYQLALYALGRGGSDRRAVILYPTLETSATDQTIVLKEPVRGLEQARIVLRPVKLLELEGLLGTPLGVERVRRCTDLASRLVFGNPKEEGCKNLALRRLKWN
jgi:5-methylcytosine-specific restriction enzyme subunit McrC